MDKYILYCLLGLLTMGAYNLLAKGSAKEALQTDGVTLLKMNKFFQVLGWVIIPIGFVICIAPLFLEQEKQFVAVTVLFVSLGLFTAGMGYLLIIMYKNHRLEFNDHDFKVAGYFNKSRIGEFSDIKDVKYNAFTNEIKLKMVNGGRIKCSQFLVGITTFLEQIEHQCDIDLERIKMKILWK